MKPCNLIVKCEQCGKEFQTKNGKIHSRHYLLCNKVFDFLHMYNLTKEQLESEYYNLGSVLEIQRIYPYNTNFSFYYKMFNLLHIPISIKTANNNSKVKQRRKDTNIDRYGYEHNFCKNSPSRKKWEKKMFDEEGITNVFQRPSVIEKITKTLIERYGKEYWLHSVTVRGNGIVSKINKHVFDILTEHNIPFAIEFKIMRTTKRYYAYDILCDNNKIIEVNGDYWHGNPVIYKPTDLILKNSSGEMLVEEKWNYDKEKQNFAIKKGYQMLVIWEYELKHDLENTIKKIIDYATN